MFRAIAMYLNHDVSGCVNCVFQECWVNETTTGTVCMVYLYQS